VLRDRSELTDERKDEFMSEGESGAKGLALILGDRGLGIDIGIGIGLFR
jgi:hypothetical protein